MERWTRRNRRPFAGGADDKDDGSPDPIVLAIEGRHGPVIHDANEAALRIGMKRGARIVDMRALVPSLRVEQASPANDAADLAMLADWSRRWCPWTQVDGIDGLLLDTTGSDHLHGSEQALLKEMQDAFRKLDLTPRLAIAPTIGAAWALARYGAEDTDSCTPGKLTAKLDPLPVAALRLERDTVQLLNRLGIKTIAELAGLPREALVRRFRKIEEKNANPVIRLDQAVGRQPELLIARQARPPLRVMRRLAEPLLDITGLTQILRDLCGDLKPVLERAHKGARGLAFTVYRVDGRTCSSEARTSRATRDPDHLASLFDGKLERIDPGFGIEAATLETVDGEELGAMQDGLTEQAEDELAFSQLIDRLVARLGMTSVLRPARRGSYLPERGEAWVPASEEDAPVAHAVDRSAATPLRLLERPEEAEVVHAVPDGPPALFRWRHQQHDVARSQGPERIAPEWWREKSTARLRDYYHIEDSQGRRFWLFREGLADDGRGSNPRWFVHGLDA
ncbi:DNA polymerase Y family protein [Altererythrobacter aurantiacus]|uniref:DNA polymerase Y family protein n=2 Tax=Parapontixanthobacter aurantiacus TaxID=1463599 RepID=A0A844ZFB1_9SPHN|nr:DNA polymerase Y family protein [Parapontixanthobacter aurantiacus]